MYCGTPGLDWDVPYTLLTYLVSRFHPVLVTKVYQKWIALDRDDCHVYTLYLVVQVRSTTTLNYSIRGELQYLVIINSVVTPFQWALPWAPSGAAR